MAGDTGEAKGEPGDDWNVWIGEAHPAFSNRDTLEDTIRRDNNVVTQTDSPAAKALRKKLPDDMEEQLLPAPLSKGAPQHSIFKVTPKPPLTS
jgi:hypothetical protein